LGIAQSCVQLIPSLLLPNDRTAQLSRWLVDQLGIRARAQSSLAIVAADTVFASPLGTKNREKLLEGNVLLREPVCCSPLQRACSCAIAWGESVTVQGELQQLLGRKAGKVYFVISFRFSASSCALSWTGVSLLVSLLSLLVLMIFLVTRLGRSKFEKTSVMVYSVAFRGWIRRMGGMKRQDKGRKAAEYIRKQAAADENESSGVL
jgi:hypothetical protein